MLRHNRYLHCYHMYSWFIKTRKDSFIWYKKRSIRKDLLWSSTTFGYDIFSISVLSLCSPIRKIIQTPLYQFSLNPSHCFHQRLISAQEMTRALTAYSTRLYYHSRTFWPALLLPVSCSTELLKRKLGSSRRILELLLYITSFKNWTHKFCTSLFLSIFDSSAGLK